METECQLSILNYVEIDICTKKARAGTRTKTLFLRSAKSILS